MVISLSCNQSHASLKDGDTFRETHRQAISFQCERHTVYLHKPIQHSLLHTQAIWYSLLLLGYKPVKHYTVLNIVGNCNIMVLLYYIVISWDHHNTCGLSLTETSVYCALLYVIGISFAMFQLLCSNICRLVAYDCHRI